MKRLRKSYLIASFILLVNPVLGHSGGSSVWSDGMMHNGGHMTGSMFGMGGRLGSLTMIAFWLLVGAGIFYLYQEMTRRSKSRENKPADEKE